MVKNIFKYAAKHALRFQYKGQITVEDLFDLNIDELNAIYKTLKKQQKTDAGESLIVDKTASDTELEVKIAIVTEIFNDKQAAADKAKKAAVRKAQTQKILDIMSQKQNEALSNMSVEELQAQLDALNADDTESEDE
jgi:hypothetical protein